MEIADTILGFLLLGGAFLAFTIINYQIVFLAKKKADYVPSMTPLIGGCAGAMLAVAVFGLDHPLLILLPLLIDPGSIPMLIRFIIAIFAKDHNTNA